MTPSSCTTPLFYEMMFHKMYQPLKNLKIKLLVILEKMAGKTVHIHFCYKERIPTQCLADLDQARNASVFAGLDAAGWPEECGEFRMFWNNTYRNGIFKITAIFSWP